MSDHRLSVRLQSATCRWGAALALSTVPAYVFAQAATEITTQKFRLVDAQGRTRAVLGLSGGNQQYTFLRLEDANGRVVAELPGSGSGSQSSTTFERVKERSGKADELSQQSVRNLQNQIDDLRSTVNKLVDQLNAQRRP